jgi:hypothetical protein
MSGNCCALVTGHLKSGPTRSIQDAQTRFERHAHSKILHEQKFSGHRGGAAAPAALCLAASLGAGLALDDRMPAA